MLLNFLANSTIPWQITYYILIVCMQLYPKCDQLLNKILICYPHYIQKINEVDYKKTLKTPKKLDKILCDQYVLVIIVHRL